MKKITPAVWVRVTELEAKVTELENALAVSEEKRASLLCLVLRMVDRWWCFVHGSLPSDAARNLHTEAVETISGSTVLLDKLKEEWINGQTQQENCS